MARKSATKKSAAPKKTAPRPAAPSKKRGKPAAPGFNMDLLARKIADLLGRPVPEALAAAVPALVPVPAPALVAAAPETAAAAAVVMVEPLPLKIPVPAPVSALLSDIPAVARSTASALFTLAMPLVARRAEFHLGELKKKVISAANMDPRLQMIAARAQLGLKRVVAASSAADEVPVIARVTDLAAWRALSEVTMGTTIGRTPSGEHLVTARLPVSRLDAMHQLPFVVSLKAAQRVRPTLAATLEETGARADLLNVLLPGTGVEGGKGVVVGIVDFGCDFAHKNFLDAEGKTRIESLWHQAANGTPNSTFGYGRVYQSAEINAALQQPDHLLAYAELGYGPEADAGTQSGTHGTHVMDIAAGNGRGSGVPGCAPGATLIFVDLADNTPWTGPEGVGKSFGDSVRLLEALKFIFTQAGDRPCVVNLSLGTNGGPHDGTTLVEQGIDALVREKDNRAVVIAASNSHEDGIHAAGTLPAEGHVDIVWNEKVNYVPAEMEIWLPGAAQAAVELIAPDGTSVGLIEPGQTRQFGQSNDILIFIANRLNEPNNHDNTIGIFLAAAFDAGEWTVRLHGKGTEATYHAWIERYDGAQSAFAPPHDNTHTLGSISTGHETIVVGSYDAHKPERTISFFSSSGPTRDGRQKPEISGPGHGVRAAWSRTLDQVVRKSGTSMAAPAVSGIIALIYAEAARQGKSLSITALRKLIVDHASSVPPAAGGWDPRYGHGRISTKVLKHV